MLQNPLLYDNSQVKLYVQDMTRPTALLAAVDADLLCGGTAVESNKWARIIYTAKNASDMYRNDRNLEYEEYEV